jgi:hypothetical protein
LHAGLWYPTSKVRSRPKPSDFSCWKNPQHAVLRPIPEQQSARYEQIKKKIPVGARFFAHFQTGSGAHPASCTMGTGSFPGVKRPGRGADHPPLLAPRLRMNRAIPLLPLWALGGLLYGDLYLFKDGRCVGLTTLPTSFVDCLKIWEPPSPGTLRACRGL